MSLKKNIINLLSTQVVSYLVPLLQLPYLSRVLGTELLGLYIFSLSLITIGNIITTFGFDISVARKIAEGEHSPSALGKLLHQVNYIKSGLTLVSIFSIALVMYASGYYEQYPIIGGLIILAIMGNTYSLNWFFQGIEKIYIFSRITIATKLLSLLLIFILVKSSLDLNWLFIVTAAQTLITTALCAYVVYRQGIRSIKTPPVNAWYLAKESSEFFLSRLGVSLYSTCGSFFLGILSGSLYQVAIYGVAEQLYKAGVAAISAISTPLTPYMARTKNFQVFFKVTAFSIALTILGALIGVIWGGEILNLIFGPELIDGKSVLNIFMATIIISIIGIHFGYPALIPLDKVKVANYSVIYAGLVQLCLIGLIWLTSVPVTATLIAITYLICDAFMTSIRIGTFYKYYKPYASRV